MVCGVVDEKMKPSLAGKPRMVPLPIATKFEAMARKKGGPWHQVQPKNRNQPVMTTQPRPLP